MERTFRGARYRITVKNPDGRMKGVRRLTVDGKPVAGQLVPLLAGDTVHIVEITL